MYKEFDFEIEQMQYIEAAMDDIAAYRPDGKTPADVQAMTDQALAVRTALQDVDATLKLARGELHESRDELHTACLQVFGIMKIRYRADVASLQPIKRLPVNDRTVRDTVARAEAISALWEQLPNPPGSDEPFKAWETMDRAAFDAALDATRTRYQEYSSLNQDFAVAKGNLHEQKLALMDFTTAALEVGRAQFAEGTAERELIDAVPKRRAQRAPDQAVIGVAQSPGPGQTHVEYSADHASRYDVFARSAGEPDFALVAADTKATAYDATGLAGGTYQYKVVGRNSRGAGPASDVASIAVAAAEA